jgi:hypothetical protein
MDLNSLSLPILQVKQISVKTSSVISQPDMMLPQTSIRYEIKKNLNANIKLSLCMDGGHIEGAKV